MADAKRRRFDAIVVYRFDRFARSTRHLVNALAEFNSLGVQFISMHEGVDTTTPNGRLIFGIFASIAEFERDLIRERVRSGIANRKAKRTLPLLSYRCLESGRGRAEPSFIRNGLATLVCHQALDVLDEQITERPT